MFMLINSASSPSASPNSTLSRAEKQRKVKYFLFLIVTFILFVSLFLYAFRRPYSDHPFRNVHGVSKKLLRSNPGSKPTVLVMVPGHGQWENGKWTVAPWLQRFLPDIEAQIHLALTQYDKKDVLVIFSGGQTSKEFGPKSEALSYFEASKHMGLDSENKNVALEEYARDSFENVLFSLCRFREVTGAYPEKFIVIGFEFKRERFQDEHRKAVRFPKERFEYIGFPKPTESIAEQLQLERSGTIPQFQNDPYGCEPPLSTKREERNFFQRQHSYETACPGMAGLFRACSKHIYQGPLPW